MGMQSYTVTSEMAGYGSKQLPGRILLIVLSIVAAEIFIIQRHVHAGEHLKLGSFVESGYHWRCWRPVSRTLGGCKEFSIYLGGLRMIVLGLFTPIVRSPSERMK